MKEIGPDILTKYMQETTKQIGTSSSLQLKVLPYNDVVLTFMVEPPFVRAECDKKGQR